jgi:hypothetical protein
MTAKRAHPLTRAEVEGRLSDLRDRLQLLESSGYSSVSHRRVVAGTKAAINVMERQLKEWSDGVS